MFFVFYSFVCYQVLNPTYQDFNTSTLRGEKKTEDLQQFQKTIIQILIQIVINLFDLTTFKRWKDKKRLNELIPYNDCFYRNMYRCNFWNTHIIVCCTHIFAWFSWTHITGLFGWIIIFITFNGLSMIIYHVLKVFAQVWLDCATWCGWSDCAKKA